MINLKLGITAIIFRYPMVCPRQYFREQNLVSPDMQDLCGLPIFFCQKPENGQGGLLTYLLEMCAVLKDLLHICCYNRAPKQM
jgi:hypothetical protein